MVKVFEEWSCARNEAVLKHIYSGEPQINENIEEMSEEQLLDPYKKRFFIIVHYFNGLQQKEITIYKKSNIKTALTYLNVKS